MITLHDAVTNHMTVQKGTYISGTKEFQGFSFHFSKYTDDIVWNRSPVLVSPSAVPFDEIHDFAQKMNVKAGIALGGPGLAGLDAMTDKFGPAIPERWMYKHLSSTALSNHFNEIQYEVSTFDFVNDDFTDVFGDLYYNGAINEFFKTHYNVALASARPTDDVITKHHVLYECGHPIAVASTYTMGSFCGLYNVGVRAEHQKKGLGSRLSRLALDQARAAGASVAVLQCEFGNHVERTYQGIGFETLEIFQVFEVK